MEKRGREAAGQGAVMGFAVAMLALPLVLPGRGSLDGPAAGAFWMLRTLAGGTLGGAAAAALVARSLPAIRDRIAAVVVGSAAAAAFLVTYRTMSLGLTLPDPAGGATLLVLILVLGSALGLGVRQVLLHEEPWEKEETTARDAVLWTLLDVFGPRRRRWRGPKRRRRERLRARPFPPEWRAILDRRVPYAARLDAADRAELERQIQVFLAEKSFEGCGGLELDDEIRVTIAAQACLLTLRSDADYYPRLRSILVYPSTFVPRRPSEIPEWEPESGPPGTLGQSWTSGVVILAWDSVLGGASDVRDGRNVVLHEFAHQLDQEVGGADGVPLLEPPSTYRTWARVMRSHFDALVEAAARGRETTLDDYGATHPGEFFAVATETFFEKPAKLRRDHPDLYDELRRFYRQDPAARLVTAPEG